jgi:bifunctional DNA-binding transcriptional regulator/antitoxin component of YhaV-PrlF toxin-antitoxin module
MVEARFSTKGQIVIPKAIRDRHAFVDGQVVDVIDTPTGVLLRLPAVAKCDSAAAVIARFRGRNTYHGPPVRTDDMNAAIDAMFRSSTADDSW